jgi:Double-GTPase 1
MTGLPESGKTTFLAALYELVSADPPLEGALRLARKPADYEYFFEITQRWLKAEPLLHTNVAAPRHAAIPLVGLRGEFELEIPDVFGEAFREAWEHGTWPDELKRIATGIDGLLLFVHARTVRPPIRLTPADPSPAGGETEDPPEWNASEAPTQTVLADLLEAVTDINGRPVPTALIVSAWDTVEPGLAPEIWLQLNLPLLWQMLEGKRDSSPYRVYGVSAQGGDVTDAEERARLTAIRPPRDRIISQYEQDRSSDVGSPVAWLASEQ